MKPFRFRVVVLVIIGGLFIMSCDHLCADEDENNAAAPQATNVTHHPDSLSIKND